MSSFSNSPLVNHTKLSPNCTSPRKNVIRRISIHCVAGDCSVETIGAIFVAASRQASSNYGIGSDGRIGMYVEEKDRAWCTSSANNDNQAVTIEVSNDSGAPQWHCSEKAMNSLINLCADICKRNGKKKMIWIPDKAQALAYEVKDDEILLTVHRWFAAKACPGEFLFQQHQYVVDQVNKILNGIIAITDTSDSDDVPATPKEDVWNFFKGKGFNDFAIAGIMGNLFAESGLQASNLQNSYEKKLGYTDASYTAAVDNGSYTNFVRDSAGYGLAQWTFWSRKQGLLDYAKSLGKSIGDTDMQLEYIWIELNKNYKGLVAKLKTVTSVKAASDLVLTNYEAPGDMSDAVKNRRAEYSQGYYDKYHGKGIPNESKLPYKVRVAATSLNIRDGAGTNYAKNTKEGPITDNGIYTIVEESLGRGAKMWGRLKSGAGWISLDYTKKI